MNSLNGVRLDPNNHYSLQPLVLSDDKTILSLQAITFYAINILTLGLYASYKTMAIQSAISEIEQKQNFLQNETLSLQEKWSELQRDLRDLEGRVVQQQDMNTLAQSRAHAFNRLDLHNHSDVSNRTVKVLHVALSMITFLTQVIANWVTLGLFGLHQYYVKKGILEARFKSISQAEVSANETLRQTAEQFDARVQLLQDSVDSTARLQTLRASPQGVAFTALQEAQTRTTTAQRALLTMQQETVRLETAIHDSTVQGTTLRQSSETTENQNIDARLRIEVKRTFIDHLTTKLAQKSHEKEHAYASFCQWFRQAAPVRQMQEQVQELERAHQEPPLADFLRTQQEVGMIPPVYQKRPEDPATISKTVTEYEQAIRNTETTPEFLEKSFNYAFNWMIDKGAENGIVFNKSAKMGIYLEDQYIPNMYVVYHLMTLRMVECSQLCDNGDLKPNNAIALGSSQPERVVSARRDGDHETYQTEIKLTHLDDFTPAQWDDNGKMGIDPVSLKWIYHQLSAYERKHLFNLLMEPVIPDDNRNLADTIRFMNNTTFSRANLIKQAYELTCNISSAFANRYKDLFNPLWADMADDEDVVPLVKIPQTNIQRVEPIVSWVPNVDALSNHGRDPAFANAIVAAKNNYSAVLNAMTRNDVLNPFDRTFRARLNDGNVGQNLSYQYHYSHKLLVTGCLLSNLLTLCLCDSTLITSEQAPKLKIAIAAYLDDPVHAAKHAAEIQDIHHVSVANYQAWMRGTLNDANRALNYWNFGELETMIVAEMVGVRIGMFVENGETQLNEHGLLVPKLIYVGPNTKEVLYIFNKQNSSYYGLFPKLKLQAVPGVASARDAIQNYWTAVGQR